VFGMYPATTVKTLVNSDGLHTLGRQLTLY